MRKYLSLTRVLLKNSIGMLSDGKSKKRMNLILYVFLFICLLPTAWMLYKLFYTTMQSLQQYDQSGSILAMGFHMSSLVTFVFSIFLIPSVFYFSKDSEHLLYLPIKPQIILSSKFTVVLLYEYAFTLMILAPLFFAYIQCVDVSFLYYMFAVIIFLSMPIYALILSSIIAMLVMSFVPFFKNRDRFNMLAGLLSVVLAFGFSFFINTNSMEGNPTALIQMLTDGNNSLISLFSVFFPGVPFAAKALIQGDILNIIIYLAITLIAFLVFMTFGKFLYFKGAIGFNETGSSRKQLSEHEMNKVNRKRKTIVAYTIKELKLLVRTPVYFLNCISMTAIFPILLLIMYFTGDMSTLVGTVPTFSYESIMTLLPYAILVGFALGFFVGNLNLISSTAISREGTNISFMKVIPLSLGKQIQAKVLSGILVSFLSQLLLIIVFYILLPIFPVICFIAAMLASIITIIISNYIGIMIDILHPKLVWEQEAAAVKQNLTGMLSMFGGWALTAIAAGFIYIFPSDYIGIATIIITIVFLTLCVILYKSIDKFAVRRFKNY